MTGMNNVSPLRGRRPDDGKFGAAAIRRLYNSNEVVDIQGVIPAAIDDWKRFGIFHDFLLARSRAAAASARAISRSANAFHVRP